MAQHFKQLGNRQQIPTMHLGPTALVFRHRKSWFDKLAHSVCQQHTAHLSSSRSWFSGLEISAYRAALGFQDCILYFQPLSNFHDIDDNPIKWRWCIIIHWIYHRLCSWYWFIGLDHRQINTLWTSSSGCHNTHRHVRECGELWPVIKPFRIRQTCSGLCQSLLRDVGNTDVHHWHFYSLVR